MDIIEQQNEPCRVLYLSGDIDSSNVSEIVKQIVNINAFDNAMISKYRMYDLKPIQLYIQSFGGSITDMWAVIDTIESSDTPIMTFCSGYCMSAAALIFIAGHYRYMSEHSSMMFHQMTVGNFDKINDFKLEQHRFDCMHKDMIKYIKKHTNLKKKFFKKFDKNKEDVYLDAKKCLKYGICDKILDKTDNRETMKQVVEQQQLQEQMQLVDY